MSTVPSRRRAPFVVGVLAITACTGSPVAPSGPPSADPGPPSPSEASSAEPSAVPSAAPTIAAGESWISFQWLADGGDDGIFLVRPDGTGLHQLVADMAGNQRHPDWAPSGDQLVFIEAPPAGPEELWIVDVTGSNAKKLVTCDEPCNEFNYPDWSGDGGAIVYGLDSHASGGPPTTFEVAHYDLATQEVTTLLSRMDGMTAEQPRVSPDRTSIVFDRGPIEGGTEMAIYVADIDGSSERRLTEVDGRGAHPDWAGGSIVFNTYDLGFFQDTTAASNLYVMNDDGTGLHALTDYGENDTRATQPRFTPDGTAIVYTQVDRATGSRTMAYIAVDGTGQRSLTPEPLNGTHPQLRPTP